MCLWKVVSRQADLGLATESLLLTTLTTSHTQRGTCPQPGQTSWLMLPCNSTVCPAHRKPEGGESGLQGLLAQGECMTHSCCLSVPVARDTWSSLNAADSEHSGQREGGTFRVAGGVPDREPHRLGQAVDVQRVVALQRACSFWKQLWSSC